MEEKIRSLKELHKELQAYPELTEESSTSGVSQTIWTTMRYRKLLIIKGRRFNRRKHIRIKKRVIDQGLPQKEKYTAIRELQDNMDRHIELTETDLYFPRI